MIDKDSVPPEPIDPSVGQALNAIRHANVPPMPRSVRAAIVAKMVQAAQPPRFVLLYERIKNMNKLIKYPVAAGLTIAVLVAAAYLMLGPASSRVYGMDDAHKLLQEAHTIHVKGWACQPDQGGKNPVKEELEFWADIGSQHFYSRKPGAVSTNGQVTRFETVYVSDGKLAMTINTGQKTVSFESLTPFQAKLQMEQNIGNLLSQLFGGPTTGKEWSKLGHEKVQTQELDVWERITMMDAKAHVQVKTKSWLDPKTGELRRVEIFIKRTDDKGWQPLGGFDTIDRNATPPAGTFDMKVPEGYTVLAPKDKPTTRPFMQSAYWVGNLGLEVQSCFVLDDGTVIIPWRAIDKGAAGDEAKRVPQLRFGDKLPELPVEVYAITPVPAVKDMTYVGRHLASTVKDDKVYEWGVFVPAKKPGQMPLAYRLNVRLNTKTGSPRGRMNPEAIPETIDKLQYKSLVLGAMAELSDSGEAPSISLDQIQQLAEQIRAESHAEDGATAPKRPTSHP